jgi:hypothetical protein
VDLRYHHVISRIRDFFMALGNITTGFQKKILKVSYFRKYRIISETPAEDCLRNFLNWLCSQTNPDNQIREEGGGGGGGGGGTTQEREGRNQGRGRSQGREGSQMRGASLGRSRSRGRAGSQERGRSEGRGGGGERREEGEPNLHHSLILFLLLDVLGGDSMCPPPFLSLPLPFFSFSPFLSLHLPLSPSSPSSPSPFLLPSLRSPSLPSPSRSLPSPFPPPSLPL